MTKYLFLFAFLVSGCISLEERAARCREEGTSRVRNVPAGYPCFCCQIGE